MTATQNKIALTEAQYEIVTRLLKRYLPNIAIWAYGSRVTGNPEPHSDLDIVAFAGEAQKTAIAELRDAFEESDLPFRVDLFVWDEIPEHFQNNIKACHLAL